MDSLSSSSVDRYNHRVIPAGDLNGEPAPISHGSGALQERERRFRAMIDVLPAAIYTTDAEGWLTHFNPAAAQMAGRVPKLGIEQWCMTWKLYRPDGTPLPHDESPMAVALKERRAIRGEEIIAERPDGTRAWIASFPTPLFDDAGQLVGGVNLVLDITERKQAELTNARLAGIVESSDDAIISKDLKGVITSWNRGAQQLFGYTTEEAIGQPVTMLIPPDRLNEEPGILERLGRGERIDHYETIRRRKDGSLVAISLTVSPVVDSGGNVVGASKIARDITEHRKLEEERARRAEELERALAQRTEEVRRGERAVAMSHRMAAVGTLASGLAHDVNNVLLPLSIRLESVLATTTLLGEARTDLAVVVALVDHLRQMVKNLSLFARDPDAQVAEGQTQLGPWVASVKDLIEASLKPGPLEPHYWIRLAWDVPDGLPPMKIASHRLTQIVLNLVHNARDAVLTKAGSDLGGRTIGQITIQARAQADHAELVLKVIDDGCGMTEQIKSRCVEPFFTTRNKPDAPGGRGSGMGLSLVQGIVERTGGRLHIESEPGQGTAVTLILPATSLGEMNRSTKDDGRAVEVQITGASFAPRESISSKIAD